MAARIAIWNQGSAAALRDVLTARGITVNQLATQLDVSPRTIRNWIRVDTRPAVPSASKLADLSNFLGISADSLSESAKRFSKERTLTAFGQHPNLWDHVLVRLEQRIDKATFRKWLRPTSFIAEKGDTIEISVPSQRFVDEIRERFGAQIRSILDELSPQRIQVHFILNSEPGRGFQNLEIVSLRTTPQVTQAIDRLVGTGLYGATRAEAAERLLRDRLRQVTDQDVLNETSAGRRRQRAKTKTSTPKYDTSKTTLELKFDFPEPVRVACEQYLVYFSEFLRDVGLSVTTQLSETASGVLFAVTPTDPREALDRIVHALQIYLCLPQSPIAPIDASDDIAVQKLAATVDHLRGQLRLSLAMAHAQHASIRAQQITIDNQQKIITGEIVAAAVEDKEKLFDGTLSLTKYEGPGFEVSLAQIFRRLKAFFADKDASKRSRS